MAADYLGDVLDSGLLELVPKPGTEKPGLALKKSSNQPEGVMFWTLDGAARIFEKRG
jgi:hypothetical protein